VNRSTENANRITPGGALRGLLLGLVTLLAACTQGPGGGGIGLGSGQQPDPATVDFPIFYIRHQIPEDQDDVTRVRPFVEDDDYSATLWKRISRISHPTVSRARSAKVGSGQREWTSASNSRICALS